MSKIQVPNNDWIDLNTTSGIAADAKMVVQNVGISNIIFFESDTKPSVNDISGIIARPFDFLILGGVTKCWASSSSKDGFIFIQAA